MEGRGRRGAKSGEVFSRLQGGGGRAESDKKGSFYFPLETPFDKTNYIIEKLLNFNYFSDQNAQNCLVNFELCLKETTTFFMFVEKDF